MTEIFASFLTVAQQIFILFLLVAVGFILGKTGLIDQNGSVVMSSVVMYAVTPAILVVSFQRELVAADLRNFGTIALLAAVSTALMIVIASLALPGADPRRRVLRFASVMSNCAFMGYPLLSAILGPIGIFYCSAYVAVFQLTGWTWGVWNMTGDAGRLKLRPLLTNPGVMGVAVALALYLLQIRLPAVVLAPLEHLGNLNTPLPMLVVGYQLSHANLRNALRRADAWLCMLLRLLAAPLLTLGLCCLLGVESIAAVVLVAAASAPAAALTSMFAAKFGGDTELASGTVSVQTLCSIATMPAVIALAQHLG